MKLRQTIFSNTSGLAKPIAYRIVRSAIANLALVLVTLLFSQAAVIAENSTESGAKKNIIILLADDLGYGDVGYTGGTVKHTPNVDQLAKDGVRFSRFYAFPACSPARAAMLTGRFPLRYGISGPVTGRDVGLPVDEELLAAEFQAAGYQTSLIGKWHLGKTKEPQQHPIQRGFDQFYGFMDASVDYFEHTGRRDRPDWQRDGKEVDEEGYATDLFSDEAIRQIKERGKRKPFCIVVSYNAPHSPFQAPQELINKFSNQFGRPGATYAAMVSSLDDGIGRIMKTIDDEKLADETIVVFASDNGAPRMGSNAPFRGQKRQVLEGGIHVPCVIRLPGVLKAGSESDQLFAIYDLLPTLATGAGVELKQRTSKPLDGCDLWDSIVKGETVSRSIVIEESDFALIEDRWKLIESEGNVELFDLLKDPAESNDLAKEQTKVTSSMSQQLELFKQQVAADSPSSFALLKKNKTNTANGPSKTNSAQQQEEGSALAAAKLTGDVVYGVLGDKKVESNGRGVRLLSALDKNEDKQLAGEVAMLSTDVSPENRWYRFYISGYAQENFTVERDDLFLEVEFLKNNGKDSLDRIKERIYPQVERERKDYKDKGTNKNLGLGTWQNYAMDFRTPFAEIDSLKLTVGFAGGKGSAKRSEFWVRSMQVEPINVPADYKPKANGSLGFLQPSVDSLVHLGGRWYFDPQGKERTLPEQFDHSNGDQLLYKSSQFERPFAGNMTSWLRAGYKDLDDNIVSKDQYRPDNLVIKVTKDYLVMHTRNLPNHPTATFPDRWRMLDGNPAYIKEQDARYQIPIDPTVDPNHVAMNAQNENEALPKGPIGVATNGVIFFNPFDHIFEIDATWRLDRCCGHPSPRQAYHYHKYPVCVKTPWSDEGSAHSAVIGFAFDGLPVYGPYESKGMLARDDKANPLNDFNLHEDSQRGPHYHVTPGKFPHIIGGYWGKAESNRRQGR